MKITVVTTSAGAYKVTVDVPNLAGLASVISGLSGDTIPTILARIEGKMATADEKLTEIEQALEEFEAREEAEDADHVLSKSEVTRLTAELLALQEQHAAGVLSPELEARMDAILESIKKSNKLPNEVLPEEPPVEEPEEPPAGE